jgi:hypothetical protein
MIGPGYPYYCRSPSPFLDFKFSSHAKQLLSNTKNHSFEGCAGHPPLLPFAQVVRCGNGENGG